MNIREIRATANMAGFGIPNPISGVLFGGEDDAHKFIIREMSGQAFSGTVAAKFLRYADNVTVPLTGSIEDGAATVTLIENCYTRPGRFKLTVYVTADGSTTAIYCCMGTVDRTDGASTIDPSGEINLDVTDLINQINTATASIPADYSDLLAAIAPNYTDLTFPIKAGQYCWYDGDFYRAKVDIDTSENWTSAHWETAVLTNDVSKEIGQLKSAVNTDLYYHITDTGAYGWKPGIRINSSYKYGSNENYAALYADTNFSGYPMVHQGSSFTVSSGYTADYAVYMENSSSSTRLEQRRNIAAGTTITIANDGYLMLSVSDGSTVIDTAEAAETCAANGLVLDLIADPIKTQVDANAIGVDDLDKWAASINNSATLLTKRFVISKNVAKNTNFIAGTYLNENTGEVRESSTGQNTSDYFMVKPNTTYYLTNSNTRICYYDINKKFIWGALKGLGTTIHVSPINACYARMSTNVSTPNWNISEGNAPIDTPYFDPYLAESEDELSPYYKGEFSIAKPDVSEWYECECLKENVNAFNFSLGTDTAYTGTQYADMIALYDQLVSDAETGYITKTSIGTGSGTDINGNAYTLYEYAFVPRAYTNANATKKHPKILIDCAMHGFEKNSAFAIFALMYDVVHNWTKSRFLETLRNSVEIRIVPVADPYGFDNNIRNNANGVNLNRNFPDENWESGSGSDYGGEEPLDQPEAAAIATWIQANTDMLMYFNLHVNGHYNAVGYGEANACMPRSGITDPYYLRLHNAIVRHIERQTAHLPEEFEALTPSYSQKIGQTQLSTHTGTSNQYVCDYLKTALAMTLEGCNYLKISDDVQMTMGTGTVKLVAEIFGSMLEEILFEYLD